MTIGCNQIYSFAKALEQSNTYPAPRKRDHEDLPLPDIPRSHSTPYTLSFSQDCMEGRLSPFSGEVASMMEPSAHTITHVKDELIGYAMLIEQPYAKLNRAIAQMAGLLILGQAENGFATFSQLAKTPEQMLIEVLDDLGTFHIPLIAARHFKHLSLTARSLRDVARALQRNISNGKALKGRTPDLLEQLNNANAMLRCASNAQLGLMPVDLQNACFCCTQQ